MTQLNTGKMTAILLLMLLAVSPCLAQAGPAPVPLDSYLGTTAVQVESSRFALRSAKLGDTQVTGWVTEVAATPVNRVAAVSLSVGGFDKFEATIGRDDSEAGRGPGLVYFEVWGDNKLLARSAAMESYRHPVRVAPGMGLRVRRGAQQMEVAIRGVSQLRLVTRYATDLEQQASQVALARGCVWGNLRLTPAETAIDGRGAFIADPVRDALRIGVVRIATATADTVQEALADATPEINSPLKIGVLSLQTAKPVNGAFPAEPQVRAGLEELLAGARVQNRAVFVLPDRREASRLATVAVEADNIVALAEAGRRAGVEIIVGGVYTPGKTVALTALLVRRQKVLTQIVIPIATP